MSKFTGLYDIRQAKDSDKSFVISTFLRGIYYGDSWFSFIPKSIFMPNYKKVAEALAYGDRTYINIACLKEDPDVILGYCLMSADHTTVHWVYVKRAWRGNGIAKSLTPPNPIAFSHLSNIGKQIMISKFKSTVFNPFSL